MLALMAANDDGASGGGGGTLPALARSSSLPWSSPPPPPPSGLFSLSGERGFAFSTFSGLRSRDAVASFSSCRANNITGEHQGEMALQSNLVG